jgi:hypothetical protein
VTLLRNACLSLCVLAAAALAGIAAPAFAQSPAAVASQPDGERNAKALKLAQVVQRRELVIAQTVQVFDEQIVDSLLANPDLKKLDTDHPGIVAAMWEAAKPILIEDLGNSLPDLWNALAAVYAKGLTSGQIDAVTVFFESPVGQKFLVGMNSRVDIDPMIRDALRPGGGEIGRGAYLQSIDGAAKSTFEAMSPAEREALGRFFLSAPGAAFARLGPEATRVGVEWMNRSDPESDARVDAAMEAAMEKFLSPDTTGLTKPAGAFGGSPASFEA